MADIFSEISAGSSDAFSILEEAPPIFDKVPTSVLMSSSGIVMTSIGAALLDFLLLLTELLDGSFFMTGYCNTDTFSLWAGYSFFVETIFYSSSDFFSAGTFGDFAVFKFYLPEVLMPPFEFFGLLKVFLAVELDLSSLSLSLLLLADTFPVYMPNFSTSLGVVIF